MWKHSYELYIPSATCKGDILQDAVMCHKERYEQMTYTSVSVGELVDPGKQKADFLGKLNKWAHAKTSFVILR